MKVDRTIGEYSYRISHLAPRKALEVSGDLLRIAGPTLAAILEQDSLDLLNLSLPSAAQALREVCRQQIAQELSRLWVVFEPTIEIVINGKAQAVAPLVDAIFPGRVQDMIELIWACLEANFRGFFDFARSSVAARTAAAVVSASPIASTG